MDINNLQNIIDKNASEGKIAIKIGCIYSAIVIAKRYIADAYVSQLMIKQGHYWIDAPRSTFMIAKKPEGSGLRHTISKRKFIVDGIKTGKESAEWLRANVPTDSKFKVEAEKAITAMDQFITEYSFMEVYNDSTDIDRKG